MSFSYIFWHGIRLGQHEADPVEAHGGSPKEPTVYYIFVDIAAKERFELSQLREGFDLRQRPEDVCFNVSGGNGSGRGYRSNTVVIPKDAIAAALQKPPPGSGG